MSRSKEEAVAAGVALSGTKHNMKRRKPWHDYRRKGTYMLTLVVEGRLPVLAAGPVPGAGAVLAAGWKRAAGPKPGAGAYVALSPLGEAIRDEEIGKISLHFDMVEVWKLCIMPDHLHIIIRVKEDLPKGKHLGHIVAGFKGGCSRAWWRLTGPAASAAGMVAAAAADPRADAEAGPAAARPPLFESGYHDQILLNDGQLDNWRHYLDDNPRRLAIKRLHPDYFVTLNYADIAEWHCQLVGNRFLLDIPQKVAVIVHNAYSDQEYAEYRARWLSCGEAGGILVSAAIAAREKAVMREAMDRGYRLILVRKNGFPPLYKPVGESFDACFEGRLLQVSPWAYRMERRLISREQCLMLNRLVEHIAGRVPGL